MAGIVAPARLKVASILPSMMRGRFHGPLPRLHAPERIGRALVPSVRRAFSLYDQINLVDKVPDDQLRFKGYTDTGFDVNGVNYEGSLLIVDNTIMSWSPKKFSEITADSLSIFQLLRPTPEILIVGCGKHIQHLNPDVRNYIRSTGMKVEAVDSRNAASTFNFLCEEGRMVAAALLPYGVSS